MCNYSNNVNVLNLNVNLNMNMNMYMNVNMNMNMNMSVNMNMRVNMSVNMNVNINLNDSLQNKCKCTHFSKKHLLRFWRNNIHCFCCNWKNANCIIV